MGMGGMGGMGGGMMGGGMGGGMGGMGGGMGGMGGGMGGMGGGMMGGRGGMGGGMGGGTMPASMGMMMLGRLIMMLVGDMSSWNFSSLMSGGMMGGMGMGGMGGMGGGMGGMGGGMMGGMGGGFRSVPPTGAPFAVLGPNQTRSLATRLVSLNPPTADGTVAMPAAGEKLSLGDVGQLASDPKVTSAVRRLAEAKAPSTTSQLVLWNVSAGLDWEAIARLSRGWADPRDVDLARQFVDNLGTSTKEDAGRLYVDVSGKGPLAAELKGLFKGATVLGLKVEAGTLPSTPSGPSLAMAIVVPEGTDKVEVAVKSSDGRGRWVDAAKLTVPVTKKDGKADVAALADAVADGVLGRIVEARLVKGKKVKGKDTYTVQVLNRSPLILNGVAFDGAAAPRAEAPGLVWGLSVSPGKVLTIGATAEAVERLGLAKGMHIVAADLSGLCA